MNDTFSIEATQIGRKDQNVTADSLGSPVARANNIASAMKTTPTIVAPQEILNNGILTASSVTKKETTEQKQYFAKRYAMKGAAADQQSQTTFSKQLTAYMKVQSPEKAAQQQNRILQSNSTLQKRDLGNYSATKAPVLP